MSEKSDDIDWLLPFSVIVAVEMLMARTFVLSASYFLLAFTGALVLAIGWLLMWLFQSYSQEVEHPIKRLKDIIWANRSRLVCTVLGVAVAAFGISAFSVLKARIPLSVPFYADHALADFDAWIFGEDAWRWSASHFGFLVYPISLIYSAWLMIQFTFFTLVAVSKPSPLKSQAIVACGLMWFVLGIVLACAFSSAGPIFYDRLYGGQRFADLQQFVKPSFAVSAASDYLWARHVGGDFSVGGGISAMPSVHLAGSVWLALFVQRARPKLSFLAWGYVGAIYLGSILLGWHYATDGLVGVAGILLIWPLAGRIASWRHIPGFRRLVPYAVR